MKCECLNTIAVCGGGRKGGREGEGWLAADQRLLQHAAELVKDKGHLSLKWSSSSLVS